MIRRRSTPSIYKWSRPAIGAIGAAITIWFAFTQDVDQTIREGVVKQGLKIEQVTK